MADSKVRISELPLEESTSGLMTIGVNSKNESVRVPLGDLLEQTVSSVQDAVDSVKDDLEQFKTETKDELKEDISGLQDSVSELEEAVWPLALTFTASSTLMEYTGSAQSVTLNWTVKRKDANASVTGLTVKRGSTQVYSGTDNPGSVTDSLNSNSSTTYTLSATADGLTGTATVTVRQVLPMYFGFAAAEEASSLGITSLTKQTVKTSAAGTYTLTNGTDGNYIWLCVPDSMSISRVTLNGFDVPMEAYGTASTSLGSYKCYRSSNALVAGSYTIVVES